ncbi:MAG: trimethylamine methyltransferase family protein [Actinomycetota bacterium]|nr:trimethylamine methyltransferase family protein [Actinomycetota bacterium]
MTNKKRIIRNLHPLEILTDEQIELIHKGTLEVLQNTGVRFENKKALKLFKENDCEVDMEKKLVKFPPDLVEESLKKCPSSFHIKGRSEQEVTFGGNTSCFLPFPGKDTIDLETWEPRTPTRKEFYEAVKIMDSLDTVHYTGSYVPYFGFKNTPAVMHMLEGDAANFRNSTLPLHCNYGNDCEIFAIDMAKALGAINLGVVGISPPLTFQEDSCTSAFRNLEAGFPLYIQSGATYGSTAPVTIAGATITNNAELMAGVVLAQLVKPGAGILVSDFGFIQNMRTGYPLFGRIESSLHQIMFNQIWRRYKIPAGNHSTGVSNSKRIDYQCGYEKAIACLLSLLSGANEIGFHGCVYGELSFHPAQLILDDDVVGMISRLIEGVEVSNETLAIDIINEVGPIPGTYLTEEHTRKWWKKAQFIPKSSDNLTYPEWMEANKKDCIEYAKERISEIIKTYKPESLSDKEENAIENILEEARKYYKKTGKITEKEWASYEKDLKSSDYPYA